MPRQGHEGCGAVVACIPWRCLPTSCALVGLPAVPNGISSGTLPFAVTEVGDPVGPSARTDLALLVWHITTGAVTPCLLPQHFRILWDGHHLRAQKAVSQSCLIYSDFHQDSSHRMQKTAPPKIPSLGKKQTKSRHVAACSPGEKCVCAFQTPQS